eukprot:CAMPEP_0168167436 /NCGR_PEP_ID=MMETSP0139_2-20121125/2546_1 /TAXON_ID=44445 /ORGANISM="Pseudo-nitzschia australis, Strain 10249 10 AB" /LENGTH=311 /DNA_ID=CAMNT_0008084673 /DNA_START=143 /DNA_END=1078 /DNA_ORIENTATION=-
MTSANGNEDNGDYENAIVAIAIGNDDFGMDTDDDGSSDMDAAIDNVLLDNDEIDHEETWLRRCIGDIPNEIEMDPDRFAVLPPGLQIKLVLELRDREKATLLENIRECGITVGRMKEQLLVSEDRRMDLEHELETVHEEVEDMKREFEGMIKAYKSHVKETQRLRKDVLGRSERSSGMIGIQSTAPQTGNSSGGLDGSPSPSSNTNTNTNTNSVSHGISNGSTMSCDQQANNNTSARTKSKIEIEFERKLEANPRYREEYERFKEFQEYYKEMKGDFDPNDDIINILNEDYRKMLEFQLGYERTFSSNRNK